MFRVLAMMAALVMTLGCASQPKDYSNELFAADPEDTAEDFADVSGGGVFDESKIVIVPAFAVKFELRTGGTARAGGNKASLKARMDIQPDVLQKITDELYAQYIADLKSNGFTVIEHNELAEKSEEYKKYRETKMKPAPVADDESFILFAPTGMKIEDRSVIGGIFTTNLMDVSNRASKKLEALSIAPTYIIGFINADIEQGYNRQTVSLVQRVEVRPGSNWLAFGDGGMGTIRIKRGVGTTADYGTWVNANNSGDTATNVLGALFGALGGDKWSSDSKVFKPDAEKYKAMVIDRVNGANKVFFQHVKMEM